MIQRETFEKAADDLKNSAYPTQVEATVLIDGKPANFTAFGTGLTKREHFAGIAMEGLLASLGDSAVLATVKQDAKSRGLELDDHCAEAAVNFADALLRRLEK